MSYARVSTEGDYTGSWSTTALDTLCGCGYRFYRRYVLKDRRAPTLRQIRGTVMHRIIARGLGRKRDTGENPGVEQARDEAATEFDRQYDSGVTLTVDALALGTRQAAGQTKDYVVDVSGFHAGVVAPKIQPVAVERLIEVRPVGTDLKIVGKLDLVERGAHGGEIIADTKTAEKSPASTAAQTSEQLTMYTLLRTAETKRLPESLRLDYLVRTPKQKQVKHVPLATSRGIPDLQAYLRRLSTAVEGVKKGVFLPAQPGAWFCSERYCEYFRDCPYVTTRPVTVTVPDAVHSPNAQEE